jgi:hypothetical protein
MNNIVISLWWALMVIEAGNDFSWEVSPSKSSAALPALC